MGEAERVLRQIGVVEFGFSEIGHGIGAAAGFGCGGFSITFFSKAVMNPQ
jgi:hypothetical protein